MIKYGSICYMKISEFEVKMLLIKQIYNKNVWLIGHTYMTLYLISKNYTDAKRV